MFIESVFEPFYACHLPKLHCLWLLNGKMEMASKKRAGFGPARGSSFWGLPVAVAGRIHLQLASAQFLRWVFGHHSQPLHRSDMCVHWSMTQWWHFSAFPPGSVSGPIRLAGHQKF